MMEDLETEGKGNIISESKLWEVTGASHEQKLEEIDRTVETVTYFTWTWLDDGRCAFHWCFATNASEFSVPGILVGNEEKNRM